MYPITTTQLSFATVLPTTLGALIMVLIVVYFTRPGWRRLLGAIAGGVAFMVANALWDIAAYAAGWWHYR